MKIVNILGGLGNQMFQYAFALKLQQILPNEQIKIFTKAFRGYPLHNGYELNKIFNIDFPEASVRDVMKVYWPIFNYDIYRICRYYMPLRYCFKDSYQTPIHLEDIDKYKFFDGYFQRASHYKDIIPLLFNSFIFPEIEDKKNESAIHFISKAITTSIHIRRGDYLNDKNYSGICDIPYYKNAIKILKDKTHTEQILVFSNDMNWAKSHLEKDLRGFDVLFADWNTENNSFRDMQLMTMCNHNIIANSSFSWWGAFLNNHNDKVIISPNKWANSYHDSPIIPEGWIRIPE